MLRRGNRGKVNAGGRIHLPASTCRDLIADVSSGSVVCCVAGHRRTAVQEVDDGLQLWEQGRLRFDTPSLLDSFRVL
jgi:hypothetical protein